MNKIFSLILLASIAIPGFAQNVKSVLTLEYCYEQIQRSYPLVAKTATQEKIADLQRQIAQSGWYPDILLSANASYQSDVTEIPFAAPGSSVPVFSKDHYNISLDINQSVFDGGRINSLREFETKTGEAEIAAIESEMLRIRSQVEQVYFGILFMHNRKKSAEVLIVDMEEQLFSVEARVRNGVLLPGNASVLRAEILKAKQQLTQINHDIRSGYEVLGELIGESVSPDQELQVPDVLENFHQQEEEINRPEFSVFQARTQSLNSQKKITEADRLPSISAFAKAAYGRPGLNAFDDDFQDYWIVGLRAQWGFKNWNNAGKRSEVITLQQKKIQADEDAFTRQLNAELSKSEQQIAALREQIEQDEEILVLRAEIVKEKEKLLDQGTITSTEYLTELNAENQAKLSLEQRKVQLTQAIVEYSTKKGISWN